MTTKINVNELSGPELIAKYNELATAANRPTVTRFATLTKGRARLERMLAELEGEQPYPADERLVGGPVLTEGEVERLVEQSNTEAQQTDAYLATLAEAAEAADSPLADAAAQRLTALTEQSDETPSHEVGQEMRTEAPTEAQLGDDDGIPGFLRREPVTHVAVVDIFDNTVVAVVPAASTLSEQATEGLRAEQASAVETLEAFNKAQAEKREQGGDAAAFIAAAAEAPVNQPKPVKKQGGGGKAGVGTGPGGETLKAQQERYNRLATEARGLGLKAKHHTSTFERHADGERVIAKLQAQVDEAKAKQPAEQVG